MDNPPARRNLPAAEGVSYRSDVSIRADTIAEVLAWPPPDRALLARELIASLDGIVEPDAETEWNQVIDRRSREIEEGSVACRPVEETLRGIRARLHARREPSGGR